MNILLVNLGRHVSLYEQFVNSGIPIDKLYLAENDLDTASCVLNNSGENIKISRALDDAFISDLLHICEEKRVNYIFSFIDYGLPKLAKNSNLFERLGTKVVVSDYDTVVTCEDKYAFYQYMKEKDLMALPTFLDTSIQNFYNLPYFAKPRYGNASLGATIINSDEDLTYYLQKTGYIVQPYMKDREFGIDLLIKNGQIYDIFMKEKLKLRAGTTDIAVSIWEDKIFEMVKSLIKIFHFDGPIDIDIFKKDNEYYINEINPRFGGGYASAVVCGKNFFLRYLKDLKSNNFTDYKLNTKTVRYEKTVIANNY